MNARLVIGFADVCEWLDSRWIHARFGRLVPFRHLICEAADVSYGWGPGASDWTKATWLSRWLNRRLIEIYGAWREDARDTERY